MKQSDLSNFQVLGLTLLGFGWGGMLALLPFIPTAWAALWCGISVIGATFLVWGRPFRPSWIFREDATKDSHK